MKHLGEGGAVSEAHIEPRLIYSAFERWTVMPHFASNVRCESELADAENCATVRSLAARPEKWSALIAVLDKWKASHTLSSREQSVRPQKTTVVVNDGVSHNRCSHKQGDRFLSALH